MRTDLPRIAIAWGGAGLLALSGCTADTGGSRGPGGGGGGGKADDWEDDGSYDDGWYDDGAYDDGTYSYSGDAADPDGDGQRCCVWIDFDDTLNAFGAWGYPFNPVPAHTVCSELATYASGVSVAVLTARDGCLGTPTLGERECSYLEPTVSVTCASKPDAAEYKRQYMRSQDGRCSRHVLIDDNRYVAGVQGGEPEIRHVLPRPFDWSGTLAEIHGALVGCEPR